MTAPKQPLVERVARAMVMASTGTRDPDKLVPARQGQFGMIPSGQSYASLARAALDAFRAEEMRAILVRLTAPYTGNPDDEPLEQIISDADALLAELDGQPTGYA